jgi:N-acetylmuramoyl-L-alanine amidase
MIRAAVACVLGLAAAASEAATTKVDHRTLYERAKQARVTLDKSAALQKKTAEWVRVIEAYRKVVNNYPQSPYCDNALRDIGDLYATMATKFKTPRYRTQAVEAYRDLVSEYPSSSLGEESLFKVFQLASASKDEKQIADATEAYLDAFPDGKNARAVKAVIKNKAAPSPPPPGTAKVFGSTLRFWSGPTSTRVVLELEKQVQILDQQRLTNPDRVFIDLADTRLHPKQGLQVFPVGDGILEDVNIGQNRPGVVRVVLKFKTARDHRVFFLPDPTRLVIDVNSTPPKTPAPAIAENFPTPAPGEFDPVGPTPTATPSPYTGTEPRPAPTPTPAARAEVRVAANPTAAPPPPPPREKRNGPNLYEQLGLGVRTIVIDAGHGGHDPGCSGPGGLQEKELVLSVALRLEKLIRSEIRGADVIMTRSRDEFVPLVERTAIANTKGADLFLSIHANSSPNRSASGLETYILSLARSREERELAQRENEMSEQSMHDLQGLIQAIEAKRDESVDFAATVQGAMVANLQPHNPLVKDRGVRRAPLLVLVGSNMPAILAEIAFLSNPHEERLLGTSDYRDRIARSLLVGVRQYLETVKRRPAPSPQLTANSRRSTVASSGRVLPPLPAEPTSRRSRSRR